MVDLDWPSFRDSTEVKRWISVLFTDEAVATAA